MIRQRVEHSSIPDRALQMLLSRDAALWIGQGVDSTTINEQDLVSLISLPWQLVLSESTSASLAAAIENAAGLHDRLSQKRGFAHVISSDPELLQLPPRALPVFFLNGREHASQPEDSTSQSGIQHFRRRLNMLNRLVASKPRLLLLLSTGKDQPLDDLFQIWADGFRSLLVLCSPTAVDKSRLDDWLESLEEPAIIDHCITPLSLSIQNFVDRALTVVPEDRYVVRMRLGPKNAADIDITTCELDEHPILDRYNVIQTKDLTLTKPEELSVDEFNAFFDRSQTTWAPYAAGVPWDRNPTVKQTLLKALRTVERSGSDADKLLVIASEPAAGGTVQSRLLAYVAALEGYPTLVAQPQ